MDINGLIRVLSRIDYSTMNQGGEKLLRFRYNNEEYKYLMLKETPTNIILVIKPKYNREDMSNIDFIKLIKSKIESLTISEGFRDSALDFYKEVLLKVEGESGIGTDNFSVVEEEMSFIISIR